MLLINNKLKLIIALLVMFSVGYICSSNKDDKKEDTKKEDTKEDTKKETTKEDTKKEDTKSDESGDTRLYFCEEYTGGKEIGVSDEFIIGPNGGYFTCMINMKGTGKKIGVGKVELRISKITDGGSEKIMDTEKFDVQPDWDYIYFDKFHTFYSAGTYKVTAMKPDGSPIASNTVKITMR